MATEYLDIFQFFSGFRIHNRCSVNRHPAARSVDVVILQLQIPSWEYYSSRETSLLLLLSFLASALYCKFFAYFETSFSLSLSRQRQAPPMYKELGVYRTVYSSSCLMVYATAFAEIDWLPILGPSSFVEK